MPFKPGQINTLRLRLTYDLCVKKGFFKKGEGSSCFKDADDKWHVTRWFERDDFIKLHDSEEVRDLLQKTMTELAEKHPHLREIILDTEG